MPTQPPVVDDLLALVVLEVGVAEFLEAAIEDAVGAFMQHVGALGLGLAEAHDEAPREQRHRLVGLVLDALLDVEHEVLVDRDIEREDQARAIVPGEAHRLAGRERRLARGPQRIGARHLHRCIGRGPAELGVIGMLARRPATAPAPAGSWDRAASRCLASRTSSMRAPVSAIEPSSSGVRKVTRGERDSASSRLTTCCPAGWVAGGAAGVPGAVPGALVGVRSIHRARSGSSAVAAGSSAWRGTASASP